MYLSRRHLLGGSAAVAAGLVMPTRFSAPAAQTVSPSIPAKPITTERPVALQKALAALERHSGRIAQRDKIGLADYSAHSKEMRFHLVDVAGGRIEKSFLVSHGRGSDPANSGFVQRFSNRPGSNASSRGSFLTGDTYVGKHGRSRRLHGLEEENDKAFERAIVIHGANYVDRRMVSAQGRIGRSLGCFAFERSEIREILDRLGSGRLLYAAG